MRIQIKDGVYGPQRISDIIEEVLDYLGTNFNEVYLKGVNIYFNAYNFKTNQKICFLDDDNDEIKSLTIQKKNELRNIPKKQNNKRGKVLQFEDNNMKKYNIKE